MKEQKLKDFQHRKQRNGGDKIFDNSYNRGDIDYENFGIVEIDRTYARERLESYNNSQDYYRMKLLFEKIDEIYLDTEWKKIYGKNKKIPKQELSEIYDTIINKLDDETYTNIEKFVAIAEFLDINYKILYDMIPHLYRANIIQELDEKYNVLKKHKIVKLF